MPPILAEIWTNSFLLVFVGGGTGALLRHAVNLLFSHQGWSTAFPWHTLTINVIGSLALGVLAAACRDKPHWMFLLGVGVCGGFTTFSTFSLELLSLLDHQRRAAAVGYVLISVFAALVGAMIGLRLSER